MRRMKYQRWRIQASFYNYLITPLVLMAAPAYAQLDRGGNIIQDDASGSTSSSGFGFVLLAISGVVAWLAYGWLQRKHPKNSDALNANIAIWGALLTVFGVAMVMKS